MILVRYFQLFPRIRKFQVVSTLDGVSVQVSVIRNLNARLNPDTRHLTPEIFS